MMMEDQKASRIRPANRISRNMLEKFKNVPVARGEGIINIDFGYPDYMPMQEVIRGLQEFSLEQDGKAHQYRRAFGIPRLVNAISRMYSPFYSQEIDPMNEIIITSGAIGALYCSFQTFINPGDEVIVIEPYFLYYKEHIELAGGKPVFVQLRLMKEEGDVSSADWTLDMNELESKFSLTTKAIVLNTPNNPTGKVFTEQELSAIASLCVKYDVLCISDEVYEFLIYPKFKHLRISTFPGMWQRTITISSAGKIFDATGWRVGWIIASKDLVQPLRVISRLSHYSVSPIPQEAIARAMESPNINACLEEKEKDLRRKRDFVITEMRKAGLNPIVPQGGFSLLADWTTLGARVSDIENDSNDPQDVKFAKWLLGEKGLAVGAFSSYFIDNGQQLKRSYIRVCFCKKDETLKSAMDVLHKLNGDNA